MGKEHADDGVDLVGCCVALPRMSQAALFAFEATQVGSIGLQCPVPAALPPLLYRNGSACDVAPPGPITFALQMVEAGGRWGHGGGWQGWKGGGWENDK